MKNRALSEAVGWYGFAAVLVAYVLISFQVIDAGFLFQALSITGSIGIAWEAFTKHAKPAAWLNVAYAVIGLIAIIGLLISH